SKFGEFDVSCALRGADTISNHIYDLADDYRLKLKDILREPLESGAICVSPDLWSGDHMKISYLCITATFTTSNYEYKTVDLRCKPFAIQKALEPYGIDDLTKLSFMSDRGTNLIKALQTYETLFCFPHRINNVLKRAFFQQKIRQTSTNSLTTVQTTTTTPSSSNIVTNENCQSSSSSSSEEEEEELFKLTKQIKKKKTKKNKSLIHIENDPMKLELKDLHIKAQEIIETIKQCKKLVRYIKKVLNFLNLDYFKILIYNGEVINNNGLNKDIQANGGVALQQSTVVRWLSLIDLLESLVKSYKQTKRILFSRRQQEKINKIDEYVLKQLICLLKPFQHVLQLVQQGDCPSLYMVLPCTLTLRKALSSFDELMKHQMSKTADNKDENTENIDVEEAELLAESEGLRILLIHLLELFDLMFILDLRHYTATLLHPRYRQLKGCSNAERDEVYSYILQVSILQQYEDDDDLNSSKVENNSSGSEDYDYNSVHTDELARYLALELDKSKLSSNPLEFWKEYQGMFPVLSKLARQIHCIPASSSAVARCFSSSGFIINERRTSLSPDQLDNIIVIRSVKKLLK
ncbi:unnamed protein product, partial [Rotaria sp. Silwood2]